MLSRAASRLFLGASTLVLYASSPACGGSDAVSFPDESGDAATSSSGTVTSGGAASSSGAGGDGGGSSSGASGGASSSGGPPGCTLPAECPSGVCTAGICQEPTSVDGVKNGTETDIDCGGAAPTNAPKCALALGCAAHADCASDACAYTGRCIAEKSCTGHQGGDTCGAGPDVGGLAETNTSCCERAPLEGSAVTIDRFLITAGRMRAFIEHVGGNVQGVVANLPADKWSPAWTDKVPANIVDANVMLGPRWIGAPNDPGPGLSESKRGCAAPNSNGHTYWIPTVPLTPGDREDSYDPNQKYTQDQLDPKALNCVGWHLVKALCAWEGGRLPTHDETRNAFTNHGVTTYPWEHVVGSAPYNPGPGVQDPRLNHEYNYEMPGGLDPALDMTAKISPPGRYVPGYNAHGVEVAGNMLQWANDLERRFTWTFSFEAHGAPAVLDRWGADEPTDRELVPNGYYAMGARCAYDPVP